MSPGPGSFSTLVGGLDRLESIVRLSGDGRWLYRLDTRDEGDLWVASRDAPKAVQPR